MRFSLIIPIALAGVVMFLMAPHSERSNWVKAETNSCFPSQNKQIVFNASSRFLPSDGLNRCMQSSLDFSKHIFICKMKTYISFKDVRHYIWIQQIGLNYFQKASHKVGYLQEDPGLH